MMRVKSAFAIILSLLFVTQCSLAANPARIKEQTVRWEKQGITFTLPLDWRKDDSLSQEDEKRNGFFSVSSLVWRGPRNQRIEFNIETGEKDFPVSASEMLEKDYDSNKSGATPAEELRYMDVGGIRGLYYRMPGSDKEQLNAYWLTYRHYKGKAQSIGINLTGPLKEQELLMTILKSIKLEQD
ncbi:MAG: hypothetical protein ICV60_16735 [Pyrinomonadaceae bacterium]|nr:hypothetical protein [Pyrinomonadaceae bacterium]